jgi:hypothetical protein
MLITGSISIAFDSRIWGYGDRATPFAEDDLLFDPGISVIAPPRLDTIAE